MTILKRYQDVAGKFRVIVAFDDSSSFVFKFQEDPTDEQVYQVAQKYMIDMASSSVESTKSKKLKQAENNFILFCRSLGLPDVASSEDIDIFCTSLKEQNNSLLAMEIAIRSLSLINDVVQNDGKWSEIEFHEDI